MSAAVLVAVSALMSATTTLAPSWLNFSAIARPMPWPAPVIMATLFCSFILSSPYDGGRGAGPR